MADPQAITLSVEQIVAMMRDAAFIGGVAIFGWKARSWFQPIVSFFERANSHMDIVEAGLSTILDNHLTHIESDLKVLSGRKDDDLTYTQAD